MFKWPTSGIGNTNVYLYFPMGLKLHSSFVKNEGGESLKKPATTQFSSSLLSSSRLYSTTYKKAVRSALHVPFLRCCEMMQFKCVCTFPLRGS